ncbi:MAG: GGDEF domain-containing protein [Rhodobacteraceae bacterium PARR1]|nr:MAG: GGDEF domain-containing protein [Rhodobacteraceae bacterium PARR1]
MIPASLLARLVPLHVALAADGRVIGLGPTLQRLVRGGAVPVSVPVSVPASVPFADLFTLRRPLDLAALALGGAVEVGLHADPRHLMRGLALPLPGGGLLLVLAFVDVPAAVRDLDLTEGDFGPTDRTVDLLWLVEANAAVSGELRSLNRRLQGAQAMAQEQALTDPLTGLRNRRALEGALADHCAGVEGFALLQLDLDHFKQVNDSLGHAAGDHVLAEVARVLTQETRAGDTLARLGGDEFVVLLSGMADAARAMQVAHRITRRLSRPIPFEGQPCRIGVSGGLILSPPRTFPQPEALLRQADAALYAAKRAGRGQTVAQGWQA